MQRPVSVDPHRGERMSYYVKKALLSPLFPELGTTMLQLRPRLMSKAKGLVWTKVEHKNRFPVASLSHQFLVAVCRHDKVPFMNYIITLLLVQSILQNQFK